MCPICTSWISSKPFHKHNFLFGFQIFKRYDSVKRWQTKLVNDLSRDLDMFLVHWVSFKSVHKYIFYLSSKFLSGCYFETSWQLTLFKVYYILHVCWISSKLIQSDFYLNLKYSCGHHSETRSASIWSMNSVENFAGFPYIQTKWFINTIFISFQNFSVVAIPKQDGS